MRRYEEEYTELEMLLGGRRQAYAALHALQRNDA